MLERFRPYISDTCGIQPTDKVLLAVSGGVDSMVMLHFFRQAELSIGVAHMHFGLRGDESDRDAAFVREYCRAAGIEFHEQKVDTRHYAADHHMSIETAARHLRYTWLEEIRSSAGYDCIATAHHGDDAAESMLMHLIRGTGLKGMTGISPRRGNLIRPLLFSSRNAILQYAQENSIRFIEDSSNQEITYRRNFVRHQIIPACLEMNPGFVATMQSNARHFSEGFHLMQERIDQLLIKWVKPVGDELRMPIKPLLKHPAANTLLFAWLSPFGFNEQQCQQIVQGAGKSGNQYLSSNYRLVTTQTQFILCHLDSTSITTQLINSDCHRVAAGKWTLHFSVINMSPAINIEFGKSYVYFDADKLTWPLLIRAWKPGDYMYPLGMHKKDSHKPAKKKISDLFTDAKFALPDKENTALVCSGEHIIWAVGLRQDGRFAVTAKTKKVLRVTIQQ